MTERGYSTIEALVALGLLGIVGAALLHTLAISTGLRASSSRGMQASAIAASTVEYLASGNESPPAIDETFERSWTSDEVAGHPGLVEYEVVVEWSGRRPETLELRGYLWSGS